MWGDMPVYCRVLVDANSDKEAMEKAQLEIGEISLHIGRLDVTEEELERWPEWNTEYYQQIYILEKSKMVCARYVHNIQAVGAWLSEYSFPKGDK